MKKLAAAVFCFVAFGAQSVFAAEDAHQDGTHADAGEPGAHGAEHSSSGLPQLDASTFPSQLFWLAVTFAVLYFYFSRKALPEISGVMENRRERIQSDLDTAERLRRDAEKAQDDYESLLTGARAEASALLSKAVTAVKEKAEKNMTALRDKGAEQIAALETQLSADKKKAMAEMDTIVAEVASQAAEKIVGIKADLGAARSVVQSLHRQEAA